MKGKMKQKRWMALVLICVFMTASLLWADNQSPSITTEDYIIGPGDVLDISVWKNEALARQVAVLPDGKIHFPLIGEVVVGGKTLNDLEKDLKQRVSKFVSAPNLTVMVQELNSMVIYVIGRVNTSGSIALKSNINVLQALSMAGGLDTFAKRSKIKIFREENGKNLILRFDYDDVIEGKNLEQNIVLKKGDIVVVP